MVASKRGQAFRREKIRERWGWLPRHGNEDRREAVRMYQECRVNGQTRFQAWANTVFAFGMPISRPEGRVGR